MHPRDGVMGLLAAVGNQGGYGSQSAGDNDDFDVEDFGGNALDHLSNSARDLAGVSTGYSDIESEFFFVVVVGLMEVEAMGDEWTRRR